MIIKRTYGSFVRSLPVGEKNKSWLIRNWGAFVGALIGGWVGIPLFVSSFTFDWGNKGIVEFLTFIFSGSISFMINNPAYQKFGIYIIPAFMIIGFFVGYGIHALIRRLRK